MDKIFRSFELKPLVYQDNDGHDVTVQRINMFSVVDGEFGPVKLWVYADLDGSPLSFSSMYLYTSGQNPGWLFDFRTSELLYFLSNIVPLFNPLTPLPNGLQETQQTPQDLS